MGSGRFGEWLQLESIIEYMEKNMSKSQKKNSNYKSSHQQGESQNRKKNHSNRRISSHTFFSPLIKELVDVLTFFVLVATLFVTTLTIFEMRKDRNENYKAVVTGKSFTEIMAISDYPSVRTSAYATLSDSSMAAEAYKTIPLPDTEEGTLRIYSQFELANIGSGMATNVTVSWDDNNIQTLYDTLVKSFTEASYYIDLNLNRPEYGYVTFYLTEHPLDTMNGVGNCDLPLPGKTEFSYMLPEGRETYIVEFPILYSVLISEILLHIENAEPTVKLNIDFTDTQGIKYHETLILKVSKSFELTLDNSWEDGTVLSKYGGIHEIKYDDKEEYEVWGITYREYYKCYGITYTISFTNETPDVVDTA